METEIHGAIEAGGTKWICAVGDQNGTILAETLIPTTTPAETIPKVISALNSLSHGALSSLGIGSFGPININPHSEHYGTYLNTPKDGWSHFPLLQALRNELGTTLPIHLDTDVNTAVRAEATLGAGKRLRNLCYITVGTGIGGGVIINGKVLKGRMHPEIGHLTVQESPHEPNPGFSACLFHKNCVEGKASGAAMSQRWGLKKEELIDHQEAWELEAEYLAQLAVTLTATHSPDRIIFGGGVSEHLALIPLIREKFIDLAGGYWNLPSEANYIQGSTLKNRAGLIGALLLNHL